MKGRGIDFEHRFRTSRWAEDLLIASLSENHGLLTIRFGLSEVRPDNQLENGDNEFKDPDLLVYQVADLTEDERATLRRLDLTHEAREMFDPGAELRFSIEKAIAALEVEFSPYKAGEMKGRDWRPRTPEQWDRRPLRRAEPPTAPNIWVKEEDLAKLRAWEEHYHVPIAVAHLFDQEGFAVSLARVSEFNDEYEEMESEEERRKHQVTTGIFKKMQRYERQDAQGAGESKPVFVVTPNVTIKVGCVLDVKVEAQLGLSASRKYVAHVLFSQGRLEVSDEFLTFLRGLRPARP